MPITGILFVISSLRKLSVKDGGLGRAIDAATDVRLTALNRPDIDDVARAVPVVALQHGG